MQCSPIRGGRASRGGFTLIEAMIASAILVTILAVSAQAVASSFYQATIEAQRQKALRHCQGILDLIRADRAQAASGEFKLKREETWGTSAGVQDRLLTPETTLPEERLTVTFGSDEDGSVPVTVSAAWSDPQGRTMQVRLDTLMADQ